MTGFKGSRFVPVCGLVAGFLLTCLTDSLLWAQESENKCFKRKHAVNLLFENDLWGSGSDRHFTHGSRLSYVESKERLANREDCDPAVDSNAMDLLRTASDYTSGLLNFPSKQISFVLGQNIFTPEDITRPDLIVNDRPYAGWLYIGFGVMDIERKGRSWVLDTFELDLGIIGPDAFAGDVQKWWHQNISDSPRPEGWAHQLKNEPGILLNLERKWRRELTPEEYEGLVVDAMPSLGLAAGNVSSYLSLGLTLRLGINLQSDFGPPRIRPGAQGSDFFDTGKKSPVTWYAYAGVEARAIANNVFLDGNTFTDSHKVSKKYFVGDFHAGFVLTLYRVRLSFSQVFRTPEFDGQTENDEFGSINISYAW